MKPLRASFLVIAAAMSTLAVPTSAVAAPPSNDDLQDATPITAVPFNDSVNITDATTDANAPLNNVCADARSVWYRFSPATTQRVLLTTLNSDYDTVLSLYRRTSTGELQLVDCDDDSGVGLTSALVRQVDAGARYVVMVADLSDGTSSATLHFQMKPAITGEVQMNDRGGVDRIGGGARLFGTVTCSRPGLLFVSAELRQRVGDAAAAHGSASSRGIDCGRQETTWRLRIDPDSTVAFVPGRARVVASRWAVCETFGSGCVRGRIDRNFVRLVR